MVCAVARKRNARLDCFAQRSRHQCPPCSRLPQTHRRAVVLWLVVVAALMFVTLAVGGATRLTGSGLSIVEWKPVTGVMPPLDEPGWQAEFEKYKTIPQYRERNPGMTLEEFKIIYWWEWSHRMLARLVGVVFLLPFLWFLWRGWIEPHLQARLWTIFGLGAVLAAVGWWMVASGLTDRVSVSQYRLAFHLTLACAILAAVIWTVWGWCGARRSRRRCVCEPALRRLSSWSSCRSTWARWLRAGGPVSSSTRGR